MLKHDDNLDGLWIALINGIPQIIYSPNLLNEMTDVFQKLNVFQKSEYKHKVCIIKDGEAFFNNPSDGCTEVFVNATEFDKNLPISISSIFNK